MAWLVLLKHIAVLLLKAMIAVCFALAKNPKWIHAHIALNLPNKQVIFTQLDLDFICGKMCWQLLFISSHDDLDWSSENFFFLIIFVPAFYW